MPYAIRKVREEIVTEELAAAWEELLAARVAYNDAPGWGRVLVQYSPEHLHRLHLQETVQRAERKHARILAKWDTQQRELADGTLVLETEATDD